MSEVPKIWMQLAGLKRPKPKPIGKKTLVREDAKDAVKHLDKCVIHEYKVFDKGKSLKGKLIYKR